MKFKRFFLFMIFFVFAFTLASCDKKDGDGTGNTGDTAKEIYTVTFTIDEGKTVSKEYEEGTALTESMILNDVFNNVAPTKEGYTTDLLWYTDKGLNTKFNGTVTSNLTLYLKWNVIKYEVAFSTNGGNSIASVKVNQGATVDKPVDPTKANCIFVGWYADNAFTTLYDFTAPITKNITLFAKWEERASEHTIKFNTNGGSAIADVVVADNKPVKAPTKPTKTGCKFIGWYIDEALTVIYNFEVLVLHDYTLYARWDDGSNTSTPVEYEQKGDASIVVSNVEGYQEGAFIEFAKITGATYTVAYKKTADTEYTNIDSELIRTSNNVVRADILGLAAGAYDIKITAGSATKEIENVVVLAHDRSGYAHFKNEKGVGAYNNDGTLREDAYVVYINDDNKNDVTLTVEGETFTGLASIISTKFKYDAPLVVRLVGRVGAATWKPIDYKAQGLAKYNANTLTGMTGAPLPKGDGEDMTIYESQIISGLHNVLDTSVATYMNGLQNRVKYSYKDNEYDPYFNMLDVTRAQNLTIEGVGNDAEIFQWGFNWKQCESIEVRNITFTDYTEDACSFEGTSGEPGLNGHYWVHNNVFNPGKNGWDLTAEQDKHYGDGATDFKYCHGVSLAYNKFNNCKKTSVIGGGDGQLTMNVTFHHNYFNKVNARLPLGRQVNIHLYNNYYYKCTTGQDIRANAFALSESNYFYDCDYPQKITTSKDYDAAVIKSYNDYVYHCTATNATIVFDRTAKLNGKCKPDGYTDYNNFDTNAELFYYDAANKKSDVEVMHDAFDVKDVVTALAGIHA